MCNNMDCTNVAFTGQCGWYTVKVHIGVLLHIPIWYVCHGGTLYKFLLKKKTETETATLFWDLCTSKCN